MGEFDSPVEDDYGNVDDINFGGDEDEFTTEAGTGTIELPSELPAWASDEEYPMGWSKEEVASRVENDRCVKEFDTARKSKCFTNARENLQFQSKPDGTLYVKWGKDWVRLTSSQNPKQFLPPSTIAKPLLLEALGYKASSVKPTAEQRQKVAAVKERIPLLRPDNIEMKVIEQAATGIDTAIKDLF